jgi:hypothetical protein
MRAYLNEEVRYRKCFADGWYLTGDLAMRDAEGVVTFGPCRARPLALILHDDQNQLRRLPLPS